MLLLLGAPAVSGEVKVWEGTMPLAASDEGAPDVNPPFYAFTGRENYPYTLRQEVRATETVHAWRALYLENEYLKCTILPEIGGHIYTCIDKINGEPIFYANPSFKKALVAYRGAWSAFGVEFNFPVSHNWVTISPVDWAFGSAEDGSAWVTVGNCDRVDGMEWTVQMVLHPASTVLEERVTLSNRSDLRHRFYWWNNAAVEIWNDSRSYYPMRFTAGHGFKDIDTWPVDAKGKDLSLIANQTDGPVSRFAYGSREPFMGIYHPHTDAGTVHYAEHAEVPAKKIWTWGVDRDGLEWRTTLSDNNSAYAEIQAGLFRNQETYAFLEPRQTIRFSEYWMPVRGIGSISRANLHGVVSIARHPEPDGSIALLVGFNANHAVPGARIEISDGEKIVYEESTALDPAKTWTHRIDNLPAEKKYRFLLKDAHAETLLEHTEEGYDWTPREPFQIGEQPDDRPLAEKARKEQEFLSSGNDQELNGQHLAAWESYQSGLAKFPASVELLKAAGRLAVELFLDEDASRLLGQAEARSGSDAEIHYYRGIAEAALGHPAEARAELEAAHRDPSFQAAGGVLLAELLARQHNAGAALKMLEASCTAASGDPRCIEETVALERSTGEAEGARRLAGEALGRYPTSLLLRNELARLDPKEKPDFSAPDLNRHLAADTHRILSLAIEYIRLGLYADALEVLSRNYPQVTPEETEPGAVKAADDPLLAYYRGYCREKLGESGAEEYQAAARMPLLYVFPNDADTIAVLRAALAANPADASAHFLLGMLWFSRDLVDSAIEEWKRAEAINARIPSLYVCLGRALLEVKKQPKQAAAVLERGLQADAGNPAVYLELNRAMREMDRSPEQRVKMLESFPDPANLPGDLLSALVGALRECGRGKEADAVLAHRFQPRKEGEAPLR
jgi:hypothetical protein